MTLRPFLRAALMVLASATLLSACAPSGPRGPVAFAASSLQIPLTELGENWAAQGNEAPTFSFASSTALAKQIESGSSADLFISADAQWTNYIVTAGKIDASRIKTLAANSIVLAAHKDGPHTVMYEVMPSTAQILAGVSVTSGDPDSVPLGRYAKQVLVAEGVWDDVGPRLIRTSSSSAALRLVLLKEADFGLLYASDAKRRDDLVVYPTFAEGLHSPILYKAVQLPSSGHPDAAAFLNYIASPQALAIFEKHGFVRP